MKWMNLKNNIHLINMTTLTKTKRKVEILNKRNDIIAKLYKNMPEEEAKKTIVLLNDLQKLSSRLNLK